MIVVTGATGFLGGRLVRRLLTNGSVLAIGRNAEVLSQLKGAGASVLRRDLIALDASDIPKEAHTIVHCAARSAPFGPIDGFMRDNVLATCVVCGLVARLGLRLVHISTPAIYADYCDQFKVREDASLPRPINAYAKTKGAAEAEVEKLGKQAIVLRPRGIYGKGDTALLPRMLSAARAGPIPVLRGGQACTDITHVEDVVDAIEAALSAPLEAWGEAYNIAGPYGVNVKKIITMAAARAGQPVVFKDVPWPVAYRASQAVEFWGKITGREPRVTPYGLLLLAYTQTLDCSKAREGLGWEAKTEFHEGLEEVFGDAA